MAAFPSGDRLVWDTTALTRMLESREGGVASDLLRRGIRVQSAAKNFATGVGGGPRVRTGRLRSSISTAIGRDPEGLYCDIGTNVEYGGFVELGTRYMHARPYLRPALPAAL